MQLPLVCNIFKFGVFWTRVHRSHKPFSMHYLRIVPFPQTLKGSIGDMVVNTVDIKDVVDKVVTSPAPSVDSPALLS